MNNFFNINIAGGKWKSDILIGLGLGIGFIVLNLLSPAITIGFPNLGLAITPIATLFVIGILAPIIEEILFRGALFGLLELLNINVVLAVLLQAAAFTTYHYTAYGASLAAVGAFIGAFLFGIIAMFVTIKRQSLLPSIILHSIFNIYLLSKLAVVVI